MKPVAVSRDLSLASDAAFDAVTEVIRDIADQSARGNVALDVPIVIRRSEHLADVRVPVTISCGKASPDRTITLDVVARKADGLFPRFSGTLDVQATASARSVLRLRGEYEVPLGWIGEKIDDTIMQNCAAASLGELLTHIVGALQEHVAKASNTRYIHGRQS